MSWLRIDDGFATHPKILKLVRNDRWTWVEILCYCAAQKTDGYIPPNIGEVLRYATPTFLRKAAEAGLLDTAEEGPQVHDWLVYNPKDSTAAARMQRLRDRNVDRNDTVTDTVTPGVTTTGEDRNADRNANGPSRVGTRARPVPSPTPKDQEQEQQQTSKDEAFALNAAREQQEPKEQESAAAQPLDGPPSDTEVDALVANLKDSDHGSINRILPLSRALPRALFNDVVQRHDERTSNGNIRNHTGLLIHLLEIATTEREKRIAAEQRAALEAWTITDRITYDASSYARTEMPWAAALELLELKIRRHNAHAQREELLDAARAAYDNVLDPEPPLSTTTLTGPPAQGRTR